MPISGADESGVTKVFIRSERLFLRPGWPEDWREIAERIADEAVVRNLARAPWPYSADDARKFLAQVADWWLPQQLVTLPGVDGSRIVGCIGLTRNGGDVELGYWIARGHWGQGYATEAARAMLAPAQTLGHRRLVAHHFVDNPASGRVLDKLGFRPVGAQRERHCAARGGPAMAQGYALDLAEPGNGSDPVLKLAA